MSGAISGASSQDIAYRIGRTITVDLGALRLNKAAADATNALEVVVSGGTGLAALFSGASISVPGTGTNSQRLGPSAVATATRSLALGFNAASGHDDSIAGPNVTTTRANQFVTACTEICLGGTTSSFPLIKRNGTVTEFKLADDSAYAPVGLGSSVTIRSGSGSPEGVVTAAVGSVYLRTDGGSSTAVYAKTSGSSNTGWEVVANGSFSLNGITNPAAGQLAWSIGSGTTLHLYGPTDQNFGIWANSAGATSAGRNLLLNGGAGGASTGAGGNVVVRGGDASDGNGGDAQVVGGAGGATSGNGGGISIAGGTPTDGNGGSVSITGSAGVGTNRTGGSVSITAGANSGSGTAGFVSINSGSSSNASAAGGQLTITGGSNSTTGPGGQVTISSGSSAGGSGGTLGLYGGSSSVSGGTGGTVEVQGGGLGDSVASGTAGQALLKGGDVQSNGTGTGGAVTVRGGEGSSATSVIGGALTLRGGDATGANPGGAVAIRAGNTGSSGAGGSLTIDGGSGGNNGTPGSVTIRGGSGGSSSGAGGAVSISGGTATDGNGGALSLSGANGTGTDRSGGDVNVTAGTATGSGTAGAIKLNSNTELAAKATKYNNVTTAGWGIPAVYASGRATAQTAAVASVATYTVGASDGSFDITANVNVTTSTSHSFNVRVDYTDETNTSRTATLAFFDGGGAIMQTITNATGAGAYPGCSMRIRAKAATAITVKTAGTFTTVTYNVEGTIVQVA